MEERKVPCAPAETESRGETTVFCEHDPLCAALDELCAELNSWYASMHNPWQREDRAYRKQLAEAVKESMKRVLACEDARFQTFNPD